MLLIYYKTKGNKLITDHKEYFGSSNIDASDEIALNAILHFIEACALYLVIIKHIKKSGVALTQLSLTLHCSRRIFYYLLYIHI